jgi:hypothetical protein
MKLSGESLKTGDVIDEAMQAQTNALSCFPKRLQ